MSTYSGHERRHARNRQTHTTMKRTSLSRTSSVRAIFVVGLALVALTLATMFAMSSVSAQSTSQLSSAKQQLMQSQQQWHAIVDQKKAPKGMASLTSCPTDIHHAPVIKTLTTVQIASVHHAYVSFASVVSTQNRPYFIFGEKGRFIVEALALDPCKAHSDPQASRQTFSLHMSQEDLTIMGVQGDTITYRTATGVTGTFNYVSGQFQ